jgi:antitoxin (DNA-binding transcriptional repressor) of toxin-antitoxin stability system
MLAQLRISPRLDLTPPAIQTGSPMRITTVNMHEARSRLPELGERVWLGEKVVITRAGRPWLDLLPHRGDRAPRKPGRWAGQVSIAPDFDAPFDEARLCP